MNKKLLALLATGALIITGCATKGNVKNKEDDNKKTEQANVQDEKAKQAEERRKKRYKKRVKRSELAETKVSDSNKLSDVLATILIRRGYGDLL